MAKEPTHCLHSGDDIQNRVTWFAQSELISGKDTLFQNNIRSFEVTEVAVASKKVLLK